MQETISVRRQVFDLGESDGSPMPGTSWSIRATLLRGPRIGWRLIVRATDCIEGKWSSGRTTVTAPSAAELAEAVARGDANLMLDTFHELLAQATEDTPELADLRQRVERRIPQWRKDWELDDY